MKQSKYEISPIMELWLNKVNCQLGFTVSFPNGTFKNHLLSCSAESYSETLQALETLRKKYKKIGRQNEKE